MFKEPCSGLIFSSWIENLAEKEVEKSGNFQKKSQESSRVILPYFFPEEVTSVHVVDYPRFRPLTASLA